MAKYRSWRQRRNWRDRRILYFKWSKLMRPSELKSDEVDLHQYLNLRCLAEVFEEPEVDLKRLARRVKSLKSSANVSEGDESMNAAARRRAKARKKAIEAHKQKMKQCQDIKNGDLEHPLETIVRQARKNITKIKGGLKEGIEMVQDYGAGPVERRICKMLRKFRQMAQKDLLEAEKAYSLSRGNVDDLNDENGWRPQQELAIKGERLMDKMRDAISSKANEGKVA
ncbi:uncharacterized protein AB675_9995 [Cyphellophora attinorum]|uniref:Uncharacterized protein n=1 Tax=Cyphellophora attinorum TaxID=1664694 RepID=A0A0N1H466_9EURO|nr:uncharacterized protein AB675_9995 [Phialophora attinorum]KPI36724.1 hypothetical protein AB675_9995 [Phialophora attinorum]